MQGTLYHIRMSLIANTRHFCKIFKSTKDSVFQILDPVSSCPELSIKSCVWCIPQVCSVTTQHPWAAWDTPDSSVCQCVYSKHPTFSCSVELPPVCFISPETSSHFVGKGNCKREGNTSLEKISNTLAHDQSGERGRDWWVIHHVSISHLRNWAFYRMRRWWWSVRFLMAWWKV